MGNSFCIGLDLGTSNSAAAVSFAGEDEIRTVPISQTAGPGLLGEKSQLASACYLPAAHEEALLASSLPWVPAGEQRDCLVGAFAREHGALVPDRLITSAKSWLCNAHVDRRAAILPWKSEAALHKFSPVDVSSMILAHLRDNLHFHREKWGGDDLLKEGQVVLTVPASFDEVARNLTYEAAEKAGWEHVTLLEEPQAAFYAWIAAAGSEWRSQVQPGDIILVCDVGGGTTDFSLIAVSEEDGELRLHRISVGDHILLGGDNMDLALAFAVKNRLQASGQTVGKWQFLSLVQLVRGAKERLFSECALSEVPISIAGRGGSLFRDTISAAITREEAEQVILEGFFPRCSVLDKPQERRAAALQEFGLPYAADAAITKHLARFLTESFKNVKSDSTLASELGLLALENEDTILCPTAVLFNGGVFKAAVMRERILGLLHDWSGSPEVRELEGTDLDLAVARGACYYAKLRAGGKGLRIKAGTARSYYVGLETSMPAVPGYQPPVKGLCVVAQGTEEGSVSALYESEFGLVTGQAAEFRFFSSNTRAGDVLGAVVENAATELDEMAGLEVSIPAAEMRPGEIVPVRLEVRVTEVGTLELWLVHVNSDLRWKLDFNLRAAS